MVDAYLSLGANLGNRRQQLQQAVTLLGAQPGIRVQRVSSLYETEPVGGVVQGDFLNLVVAIKTTLTPQELLTVIQAIEARLKRQRLTHWGPRTIDLDILYYDDLELSTPDLTIPHPEIPNRRFVLIPLQEVVPKDAPLAAKLQRLIAQTPDHNWVRKLKNGDERQNG